MTIRKGNTAADLTNAIARYVEAPAPQRLEALHATLRAFEHRVVRRARDERGRVVRKPTFPHIRRPAP